MLQKLTGKSVIYSMAQQALRQQQLTSSSRSSCSRSITQQAPARCLARHVRRSPQQQLVCMSSKLEDVPLFSDSGVVASKAPGAALGASSGQKAGSLQLEEVPLNSEVCAALLVHFHITACAFIYRDTTHHTPKDAFQLKTRTKPCIINSTKPRPCETAPAS